PTNKSDHDEHGAPIWFQSCNRSVMSTASNGGCEKDDANDAHGATGYTQQLAAGCFEHALHTDADGDPRCVQQCGRQYEAHTVGQTRGGCRHLGAMGMAMENGKKSNDTHRDHEWHADPGRDQDTKCD